MRERLVELIRTSSHELTSRCVGDCGDCAERIADHLIENGVVALPCKVGDVVYCISGIHINFVEAAIVKEIIINDSGVSELLVATDSCVTFEDAIDTFYFTREEAERALKGETK